MQPCYKEEIKKMLSEEHIASFSESIQEYIADDPEHIELYKSDYLEVGVVVSGVGVHCLDHKIIPCKTGDLYIIPPEIAHGYYLTDQDGELTVRKLVFKVDEWFFGNASLRGNSRYCYGVFKDGGGVAYAMLNSKMRETVTSIIDSLEREMSDKEEDRETVINTYLVQLFSFVSRYINRSLKNFRVDSDEWDIASSAMRIIDEEFSNNSLSLGIIASRLFISTSNLSRLFKAQSGRLYSEYLRDVRLSYAAKLLEETDYTVERIVAECGIRDVSSFYRNFRESFGMSPQSYKKIKESHNHNINGKDNPRMQILNDISINVQNGKAKLVKELVQKAIDDGANIEEILNDGLLAGMSLIGEKFKNNEVFVPEVLVAARAMNAGAQLLKPLLAECGVRASGKVCIGTVQGDLHDIGKNLVKMMMEGKGLEVIDLGTDVSPDAFVKAAIDEKCDIICLSALLTTTMSVMGDVVKAAEAAGIRDNVKIMIGGAPVTEEFREKIGADIYTVDAASAADAAVALCEA